MRPAVPEAFQMPLTLGGARRHVPIGKRGHAKRTQGRPIDGGARLDHAALAGLAPLGDVAALAPGSAGLAGPTEAHQPASDFNPLNCSNFRSALRYVP